MSALIRKRNDRAAARRAADIGKRVEYVSFALAGEAYAVPISRVATFGAASGCARALSIIGPAFSSPTRARSASGFSWTR